MLVVVVRVRVGDRRQIQMHLLGRGKESPLVSPVSIHPVDGGSYYNSDILEVIAWDNRALIDDAHLSTNRTVYCMHLSVLYKRVTVHQVS